MIAPLRYPDEAAPAREALVQARRRAAALLAAEDERPAPPIPAWQAWLLVGWMSVTAAVFVSMMLGLWRKP